MSGRSSLIVAALNLILADMCPAQRPGESSIMFIMQSRRADLSLRGLCAVDSLVAWASGTDGRYLTTTDGGLNWRSSVLPEADSLDFRDVEAFDAATAYVMSAGPGAKSRIYKTSNGGDSWMLQYQNSHEDGFFDGMAFWDRENGMVYGDPVNGKPFLMATTDGGEQWLAVEPSRLPALYDGEYGFAASGTGIRTLGPGHVWICSGGAAARLFHSSDRGSTWRVTGTPIIKGESSAGIFGIVFRDASNGVIVGGDYANPLLTRNTVARTGDGGKSWQHVGGDSTGFRSCVAYIPGQAPARLLAVGSDGVSISLDDGLTWSSSDSIGFHVLSFGSTAKSGWSAGSDGRIARIVVR